MKKFCDNKRGFSRYYKVWNPGCGWLCIPDTTQLGEKREEEYMQLQSKYVSNL